MIIEFLKWIIFDIDGTLCDTKAADDKCYMSAFEEVFEFNIRGQDWSLLKNVTDWGITEELVQRHLNRLPTDKDYQKMQDTFMSYLHLERRLDSEKFRQIPGATSFFHLIKSNQNYQIGIATGGWKHSALFKLEAIGIIPEGIAFAHSDLAKSRTAITELCMQQMQQQSAVIPEEIIYFGDGVWDYETSLEMGNRFIGIDVKNDNRLRDLGAKYVFANFESTDDLLNSIEHHG